MCYRIDNCKSVCKIMLEKNMHRNIIPMATWFSSHPVPHWFFFFLPLRLQSLLYFSVSLQWLFRAVTLVLSGKSLSQLVCFRRQSTEDAVYLNSVPRLINRCSLGTQHSHSLCLSLFSMKRTEDCQQHWGGQVI